MASEHEQRSRMIIDEAYNKGNVDAFDKAYDRNVKAWDAIMGDMDLTQLKGWVRELRKGFSDLKMDLVRVVQDGDWTVNHWRFNGTHDGDFLGKSPTNKKVTIEGMSLNRMQNDKVVEFRNFYDALRPFQQIGLIPDLGLKTPTRKETERRV